MSSGLIKMSKEIIRHYLQNVFQDPVSYVHTWVIPISPFRTTHRRCVFQSKRVSSAKHSHISGSSLKTSLGKMQRKEAACLVSTSAACRFATGCFTAQAVSNTAVSSRVAGCVEVHLLALNCLAGTWAATSHRLQGSSVTSHTLSCAGNSQPLVPKLNYTTASLGTFA